MQDLLGAVHIMANISSQVTSWKRSRGGISCTVNGNNAFIVEACIVLILSMKNALNESNECLSTVVVVGLSFSTFCHRLCMSRHCLGPSSSYQYRPLENKMLCYTVGTIVCRPPMDVYFGRSFLTCMSPSRLCTPCYTKAQKDDLTTLVIRGACLSTTLWRHWL